MNYALIENGVVINVIALYEGNTAEFANAVAVHDVPVQIGDTYANDEFTRDGSRLLSLLEEAEAILADLDAEVVDLTYNNILLEMGVE